MAINKIVLRMYALWKNVCYICVCITKCSPKRFLHKRATEPYCTICLMTRYCSLSLPLSTPKCNIYFVIFPCTCTLRKYWYRFAAFRTKNSWES